MPKESHGGSNDHLSYFHVDTRQFVNLIAHHLRELEWNKAELAEKAGIARAQVSVIMAENPPRSIGRKHAEKIALAIAKGYADSQKPQAPSADSVFNELLTIAGYSPIMGSSRDLVWTRLTGEGRHVLRAAWIHYPPFAVDDRTGFAIDVTQRLAEMMGVDINWTPFRKWSELTDAIRSREIDIICPVLLKLPMRMFQLRFSETLPGIEIRVNGVVHGQFRKKAMIPNLEEPDPRRLLVNYAAGEVGETLRRLIAHGADTELAFDSVEEACDYVLTNPEDKKFNKIRCLVADEITCLNLGKSNRHAALLLSDDINQEQDVKLPIAFAVHPEEERFLAVINECLGIMDPYIKFLIEKHQHELQTCLSREYKEKQQHKNEVAART